MEATTQGKRKEKGKGSKESKKIKRYLVGATRKKEGKRKKTKTRKRQLKRIFLLGFCLSLCLWLCLFNHGVVKSLVLLFFLPLCFFSLSYVLHQLLLQCLLFLFVCSVFCSVCFLTYFLLRSTVKFARDFLLALFLCLLVLLSTDWST